MKVFILMTIISTVGLALGLGEAHDFEASRSPSILWLGTEYRVTSGSSTYNVTIELANPCDRFRCISPESTLGVKRMGIDRLIQLCNETFQAKLQPKIQELAKCSPANRMKRTTSWGMSAMMDVIPFGNTVYEELAHDSTKNTVRRLVEHIASLNNTVGSLNKTNTEAYEVSRKAFVQILQNERVIKESGIWASEFSWYASVVHDDLIALVDIISAQLDACRLRQVSMKSFYRLVLDERFRDVEDASTTIHSSKLTSTSSFNIIFSIWHVSNDTKIHKVASINYFDKPLAQKPFIAKYNGPKFIVRNESSDCTKGIDEPPSKLSPQDCSGFQFKDPKLQDYRKFIATDQQWMTMSEPSVIQTKAGWVVFCPTNNLTLNGLSYACPSYPFNLPLSSNFTTGGFSYKHKYHDFQIRDSRPALLSVHLNTSDSSDIEKVELLFKKWEIENRRLIDREDEKNFDWMTKISPHWLSFIGFGSVGTIILAFIVLVCIIETKSSGSNTVIVNEHA